jgi:hypothetical protein
MTIEFPGKDIYYSDLQIMDGWSQIDIASGSDYSGSSATRANYEWAVDNWASNPDIKFVYGGFGTYGIAYRIQTDDPDIHEVINTMSEFGVIDDSYLYNVESRWIADAKESWAIFDFKRAVEKLHDNDEILDDVSDDTIVKIFDECLALSNEVFVTEHCGMYIDVERLAPHFQAAVKSMPIPA